MRIRGAAWDDLDEIVELIGVQNRAAVGIAGVRAEQLRSEWKAPGFRVGLDNLVAETGGRLVGYAAVSLTSDLLLAAREDPIVDALLAPLLARARERGHACVRVTVASAESEAARLVHRHPFRLERETLLMWRQLAGSIDEPPAPAGIVVRAFEPADGHAVHELLDAAYSAWDESYVPMANEDWVARMTGDSEFDASVWWLAERDGELAGCALHWSSGWLKDLAVRDSERSRGLGAALVGLGLAEFKRRGLRRVGLKVDTSNPTGAVRLYERLGFVAARSEAVWVSTV